MNLKVWIGYTIVATACVLTISETGDLLAIFASIVLLSISLLAGALMNARG
jgi:hypothetical protein